MKRNKIIFGNLINDIMISNPPRTYAEKLCQVTNRKIWLAENHDLIIIPGVMHKPFKLYACDILGLKADTIDVITPEGDVEDLLAIKMNEDQYSSNKLIAFLEGDREYEFLPFVPDKETIQFAKKYQLPLFNYGFIPSDDLVDKIYTINKKSGFHEICRKLDLPISQSFLLKGLEQLKTSLKDIFSELENIIIKFDRTSNGYGHFILKKRELDFDRLDAYLDNYYKPFSENQFDFLIEEFHDFIAVPSAEFTIDHKGVHFLYVSDQRCPNNSWSGLITPPQVSPQSIIKKLIKYGYYFGEYLFQEGYRGVYDIDSGITKDGQLILTETNLRRTGGTYLAYLINRLLGQESTQYHWISDVYLSNKELSFTDGLELMRKKNLCFNKQTNKGIILTADTIESDHKWRYVVIGNEYEETCQLEDELLSFF